VPAPTIPILAVTVLVPELAPLAALGCGCVALAALAWTRGRVRNVAVAASGIAFGCALLPLAAVPWVLVKADRELRALRAAPGDAVLPFDPAVFVRGFATPTGVEVERDLPVVTRDGSRLALDLYRPTRAGRRPTLVVIYGGAWMFGGRADSEELARTFAARGFTVAAVEYRLAPAYRFPTQLEDIRAALAALARHAQAWGVDTQRVALLGRSAGAELALLAAYEPGPLAIRAVVGYYSPTDLVDGYLRPPRPDPANVRAILEAYLGGTPHDRPAAYRAASPLAHVRAGLPPTLLIGGVRDELVPIRFQRALRDALRADGVSVAAIELPWSNHAFDAIPRGLGGQIARSATERFLAAKLGAGAPSENHP
jgi:acetyl esterase/lipase